MAVESNFFISYVFVAGGMSTFFFMSQLHNVAEYWFVHGIITEEAVSQRKLDEMNGKVKVLHKQELVPMFLFIFIIGTLYGGIAPLTSVFVAMYFRSAYKVFKYMALFIYGKMYENGGQLWYYLSTIIFVILYLVVLIVVGYLSLHGTSAMAGILAVMVLIIAATQMHIHRTFVAPSRTLSLAKARIIDDAKEVHSRRHKRTVSGSSLRLESEIEDSSNDRRAGNDLMQSLLDNAANDVEVETAEVSGDAYDSAESDTRRAIADKRMQERYRDQDSVSDVTNEYVGVNDFFIYRQPSLNRATWELSPRPYRKRLDRDLDCEVWR